MISLKTKTMKSWCELSNSEQNFYLEFYSPKINDKFIIPSTNAQLHYDTYTPTDSHISAVIIKGKMLMKLNITLTQGQRNAIIDWLEENNPYQENTIYN